MICGAWRWATSLGMVMICRVCQVSTNRIETVPLVQKCGDQCRSRSPRLSATTQTVWRISSSGTTQRSRREMTSWWGSWGRSERKWVSMGESVLWTEIFEGILWWLWQYWRSRKSRHVARIIFYEVAGVIVIWSSTFAEKAPYNKTAQWEAFLVCQCRQLFASHVWNWRNYRPCNWEARVLQASPRSIFPVIRDMDIRQGGAARCGAV